MPRLASLFLGGILTFVVGTLSDAQTQSNSGPESERLAQQDRQIKTTIMFALVPVVVAFSFIVFIFYRAKRESIFRQREAEFKLSIAELEIKALRAQINPHFIFNCLNSIHHYMHQHEVKQAGEYLIKFSQLIRYVLESSESRMVPLADDLEALKLYLELEQLRMHQSFTFELDTDSLGNLEAIHIPPMMIQPFVENSIWHGLNYKQQGGLIKINITQSNGMIRCLIEDNGTRMMAKNEAVPPAIAKKTSMGMSLIKDRLAVISRLYKSKAGFIMEYCQNDPIPRDGIRIKLDLPFED
ncbi:MAG TPA: histidine kinase [Cyclobacteriaceae bacterium]|nr:histidine kinase [Cyclobacteriaceae bacterium]